MTFSLPGWLREVVMPPERIMGRQEGREEEKDEESEEREKREEERRGTNLP